MGRTEKFKTFRVLVVVLGRICSRVATRCRLKCDNARACIAWNVTLF